MIYKIYSNYYDLTTFHHPFNIDISKYKPNADLTLIIEQLHPTMKKESLQKKLEKFLVKA